MPSTYAIFDDIVNAFFTIFGKKRKWVRPDLEALDELDRLPLKQAEHRADEMFPDDQDPRQA